MSYDWKIGLTYSFGTVSPTYIGARIENATLKSIADYDTARLIQPIDQVFMQIYPTLPTGSPRDPKKYMYYIFQLSNGDRVALAENWINEPSIEVVNFITIQVEITEANLSDIERVRQALPAIGIQKFTITTS